MDPAWGTVGLLTRGLELEHPGPDEEIVWLFRILVANPRIFLPGTIYANPCGLVLSPRADRHFVHQARRLQHEWFVRFNDILASPKRVEAVMGRVHPIIKQLPAPPSATS